MPHSSRWVRMIAAAVSLLAADASQAQWQTNRGPAGMAMGAVVGSDAERYVRLLSMAGVIDALPWSGRPFGPVELQAILGDTSIVAHPWKQRITATLSRRASVAAALYSSVNSGFAWGENDGAMWQGRGLNVAAGGAGVFRFWSLTGIAAPIAFVSQNASYDLLDEGSGADFPFADGLYPRLVDLPQRMGDEAYARINPGESTLRLDLGPAVLGLSTASEGWGIGEAFPSILGANAGGFPHLIAGTRASGATVPWFGRINARYVLGTLQQSRWSAVQGADTYTDELETGRSRIGTGLTVSYMPAFASNLEIGASRFYHSPYRDGSARWRAWSRPFQVVFKEDLPGNDGSAADPDGDIDNQLAAFFARWTFPSRGVEAGVELFRDDHNWDGRDLAQEPENNGAVLLTLRALTERKANRLSAISLEAFDGDIRPIAQARAQGYLYLNGGMRQGHTQSGQLLGQPIGVGAFAGQRIAWERFESTGTTRYQIQRWRTRSRPSTDPEALSRAPEAPIARSHDWILDLSGSRTRYRGTGTLTFEGGLAWAGVRNFDGAAVNLYARSSWSF